jgi:hypothetical protein
MTANHNDGTYNGALYQQTGKINQGLGFDGVNDNVNCGNDSSLRLTNNFSVEAWVNSAQVGAQGIISKQVTAAHGGWSLVKDGLSKFAFLISDTNGYDYIYSNNSYPDPGWHHLVAVVDNGTTRLYVDGVLQADYSNHNISESGLNVTIGKFYPLYDSLYFNGTIDEVRIYSKALTAEEVNQNYRFLP